MTRAAFLRLELADFAAEWAMKRKIKYCNVTLDRCESGMYSRYTFHFP